MLYDDTVTASLSRQKSSSQPPLPCSQVHNQRLGEGHPDRKPRRAVVLGQMLSKPRERPAVYPAFPLRATRGSSSLEDQLMALRNRELHARNDDDAVKRIPWTYTSLCAARRLLSGSRRTSWLAARRRMWRGTCCCVMRSLLPATGSDTDFIISSSSKARHCTKSTTLISSVTLQTLTQCKLTVTPQQQHNNWDNLGEPVPELSEILTQYTLYHPHCPHNHSPPSQPGLPVYL